LSFIFEHQKKKKKEEEEISKTIDLTIELLQRVK